MNAVELTQDTVNALYAKVEASRNVCRTLLNQLAELPGVLVVAEDWNPGAPNDKRNLSRLLNEESKNTNFLLQWATLAETLVTDRTE